MTGKKKKTDNMQKLVQCYQLSSEFLCVWILFLDVS
jgi:hypothetical protein